MTLPNFLIIGTQTAGTRWMVGMLSQHPDVFMPYEVHYFDRAETSRADRAGTRATSRTRAASRPSARRPRTTS